MKHEKLIYWIGTSYKNLISFPDEAKREAGYQLHRVQNGLDPENWKPIKTIGVGVREIRVTDNNNAFRVIYITKFSGKIYVLHSFQKKTRKTGTKDIKIAKARYAAIANEKKS